MDKNWVKVFNIYFEISFKLSFKMVVIGINGLWMVEKMERMLEITGKWKEKDWKMEKDGKSQYKYVKKISWSRGLFSKKYQGKKRSTFPLLEKVLL
jgi:hypothetical protein